MTEQELQRLNRKDLLEIMVEQGRELEALKKELNEAKEACEYSASFRSVIGRGEVSLIEDRAGKLYGLERIMEHNSGRDGWEYPEEMLDSVAVFKLEVTELDCKEHE